MKKLSLKTILIIVGSLVLLCGFVQFNRYKTFGSDGIYYIQDRLTGKISKLKDVLEKETVSTKVIQEIAPVMEESIDLIDTNSESIIEELKPAFDENADYEEVNEFSSNP